MKWILGIPLSISIGLNVYLIVDDIQTTKMLEFQKLVDKSLGMGISKTKWTQSIKLFKEKLNKEHLTISEKKYYYINIWTNWCKPCIKEMPWLDSISTNLRKDVGYVFLTDLNNELANKVIDRNNYHFKNFVLLNDMNDFVSGICNEQGIKTKTYPMVLILSNTGEVLHYSIGAYSNKREAAAIADLINNLQ